MEIDSILKEVVNKCSKELNLKSIIQFGSSTYSKNPMDIDLLFISRQNIISSKENLELIKIVKDFENKYKEIVFDFGGIGTRKRKAKYSITIVFISLKLFYSEHNPNDLFFFRSLLLDKNKKILFGKDPFQKYSVQLTNQHLFEMLSLEVKSFLRVSLDDEKHNLENLFHSFKTFLRVMLINEGHFKKDELLDEFRKKFEDKIKLPKDSERILNHNLKKGDFEKILKFTEDCLKYLVK